MRTTNRDLGEMGAYASKSISQAAKANPTIFNLSIGEPDFGPPAHLLNSIAAEDLSLPTFLKSVKSYENTRGSLPLRRAIAAWYARRYDLEIDAENEILVTHGGVEALALALLACTQPKDVVAVTDPSYMLYDRSIRTLGRRPLRFSRSAGTEEYAVLANANVAFAQKLGGAAALIVNSPENPTGYVLSQSEWTLLNELTDRTGTWLIHDEVYDVMSYGRSHFPARSFDRLGERTVLVNSFSKKFGMPGLRIGWLVARPDLVELAGRAHDYLLLGVNMQYEQVATRLLKDAETDAWLARHCDMMARRARRAMSVLTPSRGFDWPRMPQGGMFLFPSVRRFFEGLSPRTQTTCNTVGEAVAHHLFTSAVVATVPGIVYGNQGADHLRLVLCSSDQVFDDAIAALSQAASMKG